jgi:recombination protein RecA
MATKKDKEPQGNPKEKSVAVAMAAIHKAYGPGAIQQGQKEALPDVEFFTSGCYGVDKALGGGWGKGRIVEVYGPESSGKTTLCLHAVAERQKAGGVCAFIDVEHALDPAYCTALGVDMESLILSQPDSGEEALNIAEMLIRSQAVDMIIIDSVAALVPQAELDGDIGDSHMGLQARMMGQTLRKITGITHKAGTTVVFINQIRMKIGVMFGSPETTAGGNALKFYASQRVDIRRIGGVKDSKSDDDTQFVGNRTRVKVIKNKLAPPFKQCEFTISYGVGIDKEQDVLEAAITQGIVEKKGAWYAYKGSNFAQGAANAATYLRENTETFSEIYEQLK